MQLGKILKEIEQYRRRAVENGDFNVAAAHEKDMNIIRKHMNDGWIPVEDRLPEDDIEVLITYADVDNENETGIDITTYGYATLGGNKLGYKEWRNPFPYFKGNYKVVAWRPLPEPYHLEPETEKPDWRQGILRKFDRRSRQ